MATQATLEKFPDHTEGVQIDPRLGYAVFDADNHYYEAQDALTRHLPAEWKRRGPKWIEMNGRKRLMLGDKLYGFIPNPTFDPIAKPGCLHDYFAAKLDGADLKTAMGDLEPLSNRPEYGNREARLRVMDDQGVGATWLFPTLAVTLTPAATELYFQTKLTEAATAAFEMNDWLCAIQIGANDQRTPQWAGGFRAMADGRLTDAPPNASDTGRHVQSLACAYHLTRVTGDLTREAKYRPALGDAVQFLYGLQFLETNTRHFEDNFRAKMLLGAFYLTPTDGNLRIDATACAVTGLLRFLSSGAESR